MKLEPLGDSAVVATLGYAASTRPRSRRSLGLAEAVAAAKAQGDRRRGAGVRDGDRLLRPAAVRRAPPEDAYDGVCRLIESCGARGRAGAARGRRAASSRSRCATAGTSGPTSSSSPAAAGSRPLRRRPSIRAPTISSTRSGSRPASPTSAGSRRRCTRPGATRRAPASRRAPSGSAAPRPASTRWRPRGAGRSSGGRRSPSFGPTGARRRSCRPGDRVRFRAISASEFESWK